MYFLYRLLTGKSLGPVCQNGFHASLRAVHEITSGFRFRGARLARRKNEGMAMVRHSDLRRVIATMPAGMNREPLSIKQKRWAKLKLVSLLTGGFEGFN